MLKHTEGIVLHALNYRDYEQILTLFTKEEGLLKLITKRSRSAKKSKSTPTLSSFVQAEFVYKKKEGRDLFSCSEIAICHSHLKIRQQLPTLEAGCDMLLALRTSQLHHSPAPKLYALLTYSLNKLPQATHPRNLAASFFLKLLKHDGLIPYDRPLDAFPATPEENQTLSLLTNTRDFATLDSLSLSDALYTSLKQFFQHTSH